MLQLVQGYPSVIKLALTLLLALQIVNIVLDAVGPGVVTGAMLLPILPRASENFPVWVVQKTLTIALVKFEITLVTLTIRPHVGALARFLTLVEVAVVETAICPLE